MAASSEGAFGEEVISKEWYREQGPNRLAMVTY